MSKVHYSEVDLLETHYLKPCMNTDVMVHLDRCPECAERYAKLEEKLRGAASELSVDKPETFWARQKLSILRHAEQRRADGRSRVRTLRVAAAAFLAFFLGGALVYEVIEPGLNAPVEKHSPAINSTVSDAKSKSDDVQAVKDPWQSDELKDFHSVVQWESWVEPKSGGQS